MSLLIPDSGLLFWMVLAFGIVLVILWKFGWPAITGMINERNEYINQSVKTAQEINERMAAWEIESKKLLSEAQNKQLEIIQESEKIKQSIINEAKEKAQVEAEQILADAKATIAKEKEEAMKDIKKQVSILSIDIAEKVLRKELEVTAERKELMNKLLDEVTL